MAIPHLTDEEIRTLSREQKDRWWLANVWRGDMPQLTLRAALTGFTRDGLLLATWIQTHEPICAGIIAGAALVGIGDILVRVFAL
jgi:hypothetical protein